MSAPLAIDTDRPFPLKARFRRRILPGLALFVVALLGLATAAVDRAIDNVYLAQAQRRAATIARSAAEEAPAAWAALLAGRLDAGSAEARRLHDAVAEEVDEMRLMRVKVYDLAGRVLYSPRPEDLGTAESGAGLVSVLTEGKPRLLSEFDDGHHVYELYVPLFGDDGGLRAVFELYEPVDYLDAILWRNAVLPVAVPGAMLAVLVVTLWHLVGRAQADIDTRTAAVNALRRRLESFVSTSAVDAARDDNVASRRLRLTLLYSDVRDFTGFSEGRSPAEVVDYLNRLMALQVAAVEAHGGDVDKMVGDALLARFSGEGAEGRAITAATDILQGVDAAGLPRGVGIGVFSGEVVSGAVGPEHRRDFTVIGDSVNTAARLCAAAHAGEVVADDTTVAAAGADGFAAAEPLTVKGRRAAVSARRRGVSPTPGPCAPAPGQ